MRFPRGGATWAATVDNVPGLARAAAAAESTDGLHQRRQRRGRRADGVLSRQVGGRGRGRAAGISHAIVRPTLLYGEGRHPDQQHGLDTAPPALFGVPGDGRYQVNPVYVRRPRGPMRRARAGSRVGRIDACGPDTFDFDELVRHVGRSAGRPRRLCTCRRRWYWLPRSVIGVVVRDVVLTRDEISELMGSLLATDEAPTCPTRLTDWLGAHGDQVGRQYSSELERNFRLSGGSS